MKRRILCLASGLIMAAALLGAQAGLAPRVVASTSWVAAIARAAGAGELTVIAPLELRHPPEYELKPSDLLAVRGADFVVYSGYEKFAKRLAETSGSEGIRLVEVYTDNLPSVFTAEAQKLAGVFGTLPAYEAWEPSFEALTEAMRRKVIAAFPDRRVAVHKYLKTFAEWLGFEVVGTFGPGEPSPALLLELIKAKPALVIDNYHNPSGRSVAEGLSVPLVELINFPGKDGTRTIEDVFRYNEARFLSAARDD